VGPCKPVFVRVQRVPADRFVIHRAGSMWWPATVG
jgi:hypothetical protein